MVGPVRRGHGQRRDHRGPVQREPGHRAGRRDWQLGCPASRPGQGAGRNPADSANPWSAFRAHHARVHLPAGRVLRGQAGSPAAPVSARRLSATAAVQMAAGRLGPMIVVMLPSRSGQDQGCLNVPGGAQAATFFAQDLPHAIGSVYRAASPFTRRWALLGDSSGGYCALQLALTSSGTFAAAALPPGTYTAPPGSGEFGGNPQLRSQDNLAWLLRHRPMQPISVLLYARGRAQPL